MRILKISGVLVLSVACGYWLYKFTEFNVPFFDEYRLIKAGKSTTGKVVDCWVSESTDDYGSNSTYYCEYTFLDSDGNVVTNYLEDHSSYPSKEGEYITVKYLEDNSDVNLAASVMCEDIESSCMLRRFIIWIVRIAGSLLLAFLIIRIWWRSIFKTNHPKEIRETFM